MNTHGASPRRFGWQAWATTALVAAVCAWTAVPAAGCSDSARSHIFVARVFDPVHVCVSQTSGIDVVSGAAPDGPSCPPICIIDSQGDIGVSGMCPPYPYGDTIEGLDGGPLDPTCTLALAAYNCNVTCDADAGPDGGLPITDAAPCLPQATTDAAAPPPAEAGARSDSGSSDGASSDGASAGGGSTDGGRSD